MKDSHYRISLDIHSTQSQVSLPVKQGDTSRKVFISLCEGGKPYHIEDDCFAVFSAKKPDKTEIYDDCIIADNTIEYEFTEDVTAASGIVGCEIRLYGVDRGIITSPRFTVIVDDRVIGDAGAKSYSSYDALDALVSQATEAIANANGKAELANTAAGNADEKAGLAEAAANNANEVATATEAVKTDVETKLANGEFKGEKGEKGDPADYNLVTNALKGFASGKAITLADVSPLEHELKVKLSSVSITDFSSVTLKKCGKNILPVYSDLATKTINGVTFTVNEDKSVTCNGTANDNAVFRLTTDYRLPLGVYTLRGCPTDGNENARLQTNKLIDGVAKTGAIDMGSGGTLSVDDEYYVYTYIVVVSGQKVSNLTFKPMLLLEEETDVSYEPNVVVKTYTPNADGTVDNVTSLYPTTVLTTDTEGVVIDVEYNKDANKVVADILTIIKNLNRISYINLLSAKWTKEEDRLYSQVVDIAGVTANSFIEICFTDEQLKTFSAKDISFSAVNRGGVVTVKCVGQKPTLDYRLQVKITEVSINE